MRREQRPSTQQSYKSLKFRCLSCSATRARTWEARARMSTRRRSTLSAVDAGRRALRTCCTHLPSGGRRAALDLAAYRALFLSTNILPLPIGPYACSSIARCKQYCPCSSRRAWRLHCKACSLATTDYWRRAAPLAHPSAAGAPGARSACVECRRGVAITMTTSGRARWLPGRCRGSRQRQSSDW